MCSLFRYLAFCFQFGYSLSARKKCACRPLVTSIWISRSGSTALRVRLKMFSELASNFGSILKISINQTLFISSSCCFRVGCLTEFFCLVYSLEVVFIFHFFPVLICIDTGTVLNNEIFVFSVSSHYRSALQLLTSTQVKSRRYFALLLVRSAIRFIGQALV